MVSLPQRSLVVELWGQPVRVFRVAVGAPDNPTPLGEFVVQEKRINWGRGFGTRWLGLSVPWGQYGIHGTNKPYSIGRYASHGCVRMFNRDVEALYALVPKGTKVVIVGPPHRLNLSRGSKGSDVVDVQNRLRELGYYQGPINGTYGPATELAMRRFQRENGLTVTGSVTAQTYVDLGLEREVPDRMPKN